MSEAGAPGRASHEITAERWGIAADYEDYRGERRSSPPGTVEAILGSMGASETGGPPPPGAVVVRPGAAVEGVAVLTEDGGEVAIDGRLPQDLPLGYHRLVRRDGSDISLIVSPGVCHPPPAEASWGWAVQLYALRSGASWGMGDLEDLRALGRWARSMGAGTVLINPLHASVPGHPQQASPYSPSSRRWRNPLYLRIEEIPGAADPSTDLASLVAAGQGLNENDRIDRDAVYGLKMDALQRVWERVPEPPEVDSFRKRAGKSLTDYATYVGLAESFGPDRRRWPSEFSTPDSAQVRDWRSAHERRVRFHEWVQWALNRQLEAAGHEIDIVNDLAVGVDPQGAEAWVWQDVLVDEMSVGAPPDRFNALGQDWGIPPFDPHALRASGYRAFVEMVRAGLALGAGLRIDHVMGLWRLFWIPEGASAADGAYVRYPWRDLLDIVALESVRSGSYIVGEDLGTVEPLVRAEMAERNMLSYRILWFEPQGAKSFPELSLAAATNHDLPTIAGLWSGADMREQQRLGLRPSEEAMRAQRDSLAKRIGAAEDDSIDEVIVGTYEYLGSTPSRIVVATLEDASAQVERPNQPGTTSERPNWSIPLPLSLEELVAHPRPRAIARALGRSRDISS